MKLSRVNANLLCLGNIAFGCFSSTSKAVFYIKHNIRKVQDDKERLETKRNCIKRSEFTLALKTSSSQSFYPLRLFGENSSQCNLTGRLAQYAKSLISFQNSYSLSMLTSSNVSSDYKHLTPNHKISFENRLIMIYTLKVSLQATLTFKICHNHIYLCRNHPSASTAICTPIKLTCVAGAWKQWAQEKTGAREGDTLTPRVFPSRAPVLSFAHYFQAPATQATNKHIERSLLSSDYSQ